MTSWALLLLASVLLATPGLTFSGLTPEDHDDLSTVDMCQEEHFFEVPAQEASKDDQMIFTCIPCKIIIRLLMKYLGEYITEEAIKHAASLLCEETFVLTHLCHKIITKYLSDITLRILNDKSPQAICVKLGMCRPDIGLTFSGLTPEDHEDLFTADMCQEEHFFEVLAQLAAKGDPQFNQCDLCKLIVNWLKNCLRGNLIQKAFEKVASLVCSKFPFVENHCKETIRKFLGEITYCIVNVEPAKRICVIFSICSPWQVTKKLGPYSTPGRSTESPAGTASSCLPKSRTDPPVSLS
ncbi:uncharacterized protein [Vulpes vulpes]|uniref:Saposin B-type domain-containing protein n=1 Tax=Vulpes vulpes TaxID=9627 RepID=A0ABM5B2F9_VULVU